LVLAKATETFQAGANTVTWVLDSAGRQLAAIGDQVVHASKEAAQAFARKLEEFGRPFADLWQQLQDFGTAAQRVLQALVNAAAASLRTLAAGVGGGLQDFFNGLRQPLPQQLFQWLTAGVSTLPPLPGDLTNTREVGGWLLQVFRLGWDQIKP